MRDEQEIGSFEGFGDKVNEAYKTYASLYMDFCDDNLDHFFWRDKDIKPLENISPIERNAENISNAYIKESLDIAKSVLSSGYYSSFEQLFEDYPLLEQYKDELENEFYYDEKDEI